MIQKIALVLGIFLITTFIANAQNSKEFYESIVNHSDFSKKAPIALPNVNTLDDALWTKIIWRELVLREKMNLPLYYPTTPIDGRMSLIDVLMKGVERSFKTAYEEDELKTPITIEEIKKRFDPITETVSKLNNETGEREEVTVEGEIHTDEVKRFLIKEVWYFNQKTSRLESRIIAICPVREYTRDDFDGILKRQLFWIDYGEFRDIFAKQKVFIYENDGGRVTLDDIFLKRYFSSRIYQEANVYNNRSINSYTVGMDAMLESDRIKNDIFTAEQDLWEY